MTCYFSSGLCSSRKEKRDRRSPSAVAAGLFQFRKRLIPELLSPIQSESMQADLVDQREREQFVKAGTMMINAVRSTVKSFVHRMPRCSSSYFCPLPANALIGVVARSSRTLLDQIALLGA